MKLRILYLSPWFPFPLDTGSRTRVHHLVRGLAERHSVTLLTLDPAGWAPAIPGGMAPYCEETLIVGGDPFTRSRSAKTVAWLGLRPSVSAPLADMSRAVCRLQRARPFDALVTASFVMGAYAECLPGVPAVMEEHNSLSRWMNERYLSRRTIASRVWCWASWQKTRRYERSLYRRFRAVSMVSEADAATARDLVSGDHPVVEVVPNGVDCGHFRPGLAVPDGETLVFGGALAYAANWEAMRFFLTHVYPLVRAARPSVQLRITGAASVTELSALPIDDSVHATGYLEDVRPAIAGAAVSIVPILDGGGTRIKILEAMALGTPVVATTKGVEGLDLTPGNDVLLGDRPSDFAAMILRLLADAGLRRRIAVNARAAVCPRYDWRAIGSQFADIVEAAACGAAVGQTTGVSVVGSHWGDAAE